MKQSNVRIASGVWVAGFVLSFGISSVSIPPYDMPIYIGLGCLAIIPLIFGSVGYRVFGAIALITSVVLTVSEFQAGVVHRERMRRIVEKIREQQKTNQPPVVQTTNDGGSRP